MTCALRMEEEARGAHLLICWGGRTWFLSSVTADTNSSRRTATTTLSSVTGREGGRETKTETERQRQRQRQRDRDRDSDRETERKRDRKTETGPREKQPEKVDHCYNHDEKVDKGLHAYDKRLKAYGFSGFRVYGSACARSRQARLPTTRRRICVCALLRMIE